MIKSRIFMNSVACGLGMLAALMVFSLIGGRYFYPSQSVRFDRLTGTVEGSRMVKAETFRLVVVDPFEIDDRVREGDNVLWYADLRDPVYYERGDGKWNLVIRERDEFEHFPVGERVLDLERGIFLPSGGWVLLADTTINSAGDYVFLPAEPRAARRPNHEIEYWSIRF